MDGKTCKICKKTGKLIYSITQEAYLCLTCNKNQFPKQPFPANPDQNFFAQKQMEFKQIIDKYHNL